MKDSTKIKLKKLLKEELGREPSKNELANAETDHNLIAKLSISMLEDTNDEVEAVKIKTEETKLKVDNADKEIKKLKKI